MDEPKFFLRHGERARIPVTISIPEGAEAGGRYASILISTLIPLDKSLTDQGTQGGVPLITQSGTLVFVTIPGEIKHEGRLKDFLLAGEQMVFFAPEDVFFDLIFENTGLIHLRPYGTITVKNILGQEVKKIELDPWFVMPHAQRLRQVGLMVEAESKFMFGFYRADAEIFRGYDDLADQLTLNFIVLPWKILLIALLILFFLTFFLTWLIRYLRSHFQLKAASPATPTPPAPPSSPVTPPQA